MKTLYAVLSLLLSLNAQAQGGGGSVGNGGTDREQDFAYFAGQVQHLLTLRIVEFVNEVRGRPQDNQDIIAKIKSANVSFSDEELLIDGKPRTCMNFPALNLIRCNNQRWDLVPVKQRMAFALHEYLGLLEWESNDGNFSVYPFSRLLLDLESTLKVQFVARAGSPIAARKVPAPILAAAKAMAYEGAAFHVGMDGSFAMNNPSMKGRDHARQAWGYWMGQTDYYFEISVYRNGVQLQLGGESIQAGRKFKTPIGSEFQLRLVWSAEDGVRAIHADHHFFWQSEKAIKVRKVKFLADGSALVATEDETAGRYPRTVQLRVNGRKYSGSYLGPGLQPTGVKSAIDVDIQAEPGRKAELMKKVGW